MLALLKVIKLEQLIAQADCTFTRTYSALSRWHAVSICVATCGLSPANSQNISLQPVSHGSNQIDVEGVLSILHNLQQQAVLSCFVTAA